MVCPVLTNLQKINNLETRVNLLTTLETFISNAVPCVFQKGLGEGVIYMHISEMYS